MSRRNVAFRMTLTTSAIGKASHTSSSRPVSESRYAAGSSTTIWRQTELTSGDAAVTMKGADGLVQLAIWQADGYTYAVSVENGLTADAMAELVAQVR